MTKQFVRGYAERADDGSVPGDLGDPLWFVATTEGRKADGIDLQMDRLRLERFEANPVIGYGHNYWGRDSLPIGQAVDIDVDAPALRLQVQFDQDDEFAVRVEQKVRGRYLRAMSVGFDAWDIDENGVPAAWELFESSIVPIPMDPEALAEVGRAAYRDLDAAMTQIAEALGGEAPERGLPPEILRVGRTLTDDDLERIRQAFAEGKTTPAMKVPPGPEVSPLSAHEKRLRRLRIARATSH